MRVSVGAWAQVRVEGRVSADEGCMGKVVCACEWVGGRAHGGSEYHHKFITHWYSFE